MTIDEAIKHAEEEAEEQDKLCKRYDDASGFTRSHNEEIRTSAAKQCEKCADEHRQLTEWLKELKQLREQTRWIPVSERLPEDGQSVLFCDIDNDIMVGYHVKGRPDTHFSQDGTYDDMKNVRAWMPLPKPYVPQESEE